MLFPISAFAFLISFLNSIDGQFILTFIPLSSKLLVEWEEGENDRLKNALQNIISDIFEHHNIKFLLRKPSKVFLVTK
jgi:hypothetical protein